MNGKVFNDLSGIFAEIFLKTLSWGTKNGKDHDSESTALVNFPIMFTLIKRTIDDDKIEPEAISKSIQSVIKNHVKSKAVK